MNRFFTRWFDPNEPLYHVRFMERVKFTNWCGSELIFLHNGKEYRLPSRHTLSINKFGGKIYDSSYNLFDYSIWKANKNNLQVEYSNPFIGPNFWNYDGKKIKLEFEPTGIPGFSKLLFKKMDYFDTVK